MCHLFSYCSVKGIPFFGPFEHPAPVIGPGIFDPSQELVSGKI
jgi:hypothetical protein